MDKTLQDTIEVIISARILLLVEQGKTLESAFNEVLGEGAYRKLAYAIHEILTKN